MRISTFSVATVFMLTCATLVRAQDSADLYNPQHSVARNWNEVLLAAVRVDYARPTVHARNLFHTSALMYDAWAVYAEDADTFFLGNTVGGYQCPLSTAQRNALRDRTGDDVEAVEQARAEAISYGMYRLLTKRFADSPGAAVTILRINNMADALQVDGDFTSTDIGSASPAALGNYLANCIIEFGLQDGSNEANDYANAFYQPVNEPLNPAESGTPGMNDPDRWQPLQLDIFIDQAGNVTNTPPFLGAEWGKVVPFALADDDLTIHQRDGEDYWVYFDPGEPARLGDPVTAAEYEWNHMLVALWSAHLDPADGVMIDISPASVGNTSALPNDLFGLREFYQMLEGGVAEEGHDINPVTGRPYATQVVPRGDYVRVLAEFWADGPNSETPPGHWFTILNQAVHDHPDFVRRFEGVGPVLNNLEWDVKAYFTLGGAVHDSAVTAWGIKGWYDYVRPVSAIRYMASLGQRSEPQLANYHPQGVVLHEGRVEVVEAGDPLAGDEGEHSGKIKLYAWRGPDYISDPDTSSAGVGWILAENWWPYQRPSFVTPPFAGYVSGHSTFSRAAAEILTMLTGSEYFPGGVGEFVAKKNEFLVFEEGPSVDIVLQWATYRDASDQTSLSRIWGGIHPPVDDIAGRRIGAEIAVNTFALAKSYFNGTAVTEPTPPATEENSSSGGGGGALGWYLLFVIWILGRCFARYRKQISSVLSAPTRSAAQRPDASIRVIAAISDRGAAH